MSHSDAVANKYEEPLSKEITALNASGTGNVLYYVTDHLGSVRTIKDGAGTVRQRFDYYPFGTVSRVYTSSSTTDNSVKRFRFGGKEIAGSALTDLAGMGAAPGAPYLDFGARLYSPQAASWLSTDPMAEKYYGIGPYVYCAGSPVNLVDPEGSTIVIWFSENGDHRAFHYSGRETGIPDNYYVQAVIDAYKYNKENWENAGFEGNSPSTDLVERTDIMVSIYEEKGYYSEYKTVNGGTPYIRWNPYEGVTTDQGAILSPATILAHESDHAIDDFTNSKAHSDRRRMPDPLYDNAEERRVITGSERKTAIANGEIRQGQTTRGSHEATTVYTYGPTSNMIDKVATNIYRKMYNKRNY